MSDTVKVGERRTFRSTLQGEDGQGILVRLYTGQQVDVLESMGEQPEDDPECAEPMFKVRADDGVTFSAWWSELVEHGTNVYVTPDGEYVTDPDFRFAEEAER